MSFLWKRSQVDRPRPSLLLRRKSTRCSFLWGKLYTPAANLCVRPLQGAKYHSVKRQYDEAPQLLSHMESHQQNDIEGRTKQKPVACAFLIPHTRHGLLSGTISSCGHLCAFGYTRGQSRPLQGLLLSCISVLATNRQPLVYSSPPSTSIRRTLAYNTSTTASQTWLAL